jgi:hypothetical protein
MSLEDLKKSAQHIDKEQADNSWGPDIPPYLEEAPPLQPRDQDYTHSVFFDARRFKTEVEQDALLQRVSGQFPQFEHWCLYAVSAADLAGCMHLYGANHAQMFQRDGFVAEIEPPRFKRKAPPRSIRSQQAWEAFLINAVIAEAIVDAWRKLPPDRKLNGVFRDPLIDAVAPILGKTDENDETPGVNLLCAHEGLFVAPRNYETERVLYLADPVTFQTAFAKGRALFPSLYLHERVDIRRRIDMEIAAWSRDLGDTFSIDGLVLWISQTLAVLRLQATEWRFRERPGYIKSGTREFANDPDAAATKDEYVRQQFVGIIDALRQPDNFVEPTILRTYANTQGNVISRLAGGIGLDDEATWRDENTKRRNFSSHALYGVAEWISILKQSHHTTLDLLTAQLIYEIVTGNLDDLDELKDKDDRLALSLIKSQFPDAIWRKMLEIAVNSSDNFQTIQVRYRWNDNPIDPIKIEEDGDTIVIFGPLLDLRAQKHEVWTERAEMFRDRGTLTV